MQNSKSELLSTETEVELIPCTACIDGRWETECCNGSGGCDCGGQVLDMGPCNVCDGTSLRHPDADVRANLRKIAGACFIGAGPRYGWEGAHRAGLSFMRAAE